MNKFEEGSSVMSEPRKQAAIYFLLAYASLLTGILLTLWFMYWPIMEVLE